VWPAVLYALFQHIADRLTTSKLLMEFADTDRVYLVVFGQG